LPELTFEAMTDRGPQILYVLAAVAALAFILNVILVVWAYR
jgi:hypothetical protein